MAVTVFQIVSSKRLDCSYRRVTHPKFHLGILCVPMACCLLSPTFPSAPKREPNSVYLCNKYHIQSDGKRLEAFYKQRTKLRFLSQGPKEHTVDSTSHHTWPPDLTGLWNLSLGELQQDLEPARWARTCSLEVPSFSPDFNTFSVLVTIRALFFFLSPQYTQISFTS